MGWVDRSRQSCLALAALAAIACAGTPVTGSLSPSSSPVGTAEPSVVTPAPSVSPKPTSQATPIPVESPTPSPSAGPSLPLLPLAESMLDCDNGTASGFSDDLDGLAAGRTPDEALQHLLDLDQYFLPLEGYVPFTEIDEIVAFRYERQGLAKAAVVVANESVLASGPSRPWVATSFGICDFSEFRADVALGSHYTVWRNMELDRIGIDTPGSRHCGLQSVRFLRFDWVEPPFIRDPEGKLVNELPSQYLGDTDLPPGATDTGYRRGGDELWRVPDEAAMYVVTPQATERWPQDSGDWGCA